MKTKYALIYYVRRTNSVCGCSYSIDQVTSVLPLNSKTMFSFEKTLTFSITVLPLQRYTVPRAISSLIVLYGWLITFAVL